jgi:hypothetical protein
MRDPAHALAAESCDWQRPKDWHCEACGLSILQQHEDVKLASMLRFFREHALRAVNEVATHSSFLGLNDPTCYTKSFNFPCDADVIQNYCDAVV